MSASLRRDSTSRDEQQLRRQPKASNTTATTTTTATATTTSNTTATPKAANSNGKSSQPATRLESPAPSVNLANGRPSVASAASAVPTATAGGKLVFGLSSRTNRLKHDEYAESRRRVAAASKLEQCDSELRDQQFEKQPAPAKSPSPAATQMTSENGSGLRATETRLGEAKPQSSLGSATSTIRSSRYGNFQQKQAAPPVASQASVASNKMSRDEPRVTKKSPTTNSSSTPPTTTATASASATTTSAAPKKRTKSPISRAKSEGQLATSSTVAAATTTTSTSQQSDTQAASSQSNDTQVVPAKPRMQFSIPPPPKMNTSSAKSSVVSYAKSRIYDKPARQILSNPPSGSDFSSASSILDSLSVGSHEKIPKSILSGFKPPKQVNVSKAREKWEGGEPFARCKSRQRLAAKASGKKLLHGAWSMTSVVATQQLQFQQAVAANSLGPRGHFGASSSSLLNSDPSVKVLTRGSVFERVQQFERTPSSSSGGSSIASSSSSSSITSDGSEASSGDESSVKSDSIPEEPLSPTRGQSDADAGEASITINRSIEDYEAKPTSSPESPGSKAAQYKNKVSSLQRVKPDPQLKLAVGGPKTGTAPSAAQKVLSPRSPTIGDSPPFAFTGSQTRRLSLRRRSSTSGDNSSSANIPKFYHPIGRPNTYEIELQKKNIIACFDKFPERKALLVGPNSRRHFHSISLACSFSEYLKEPLCSYAKYYQLNHSKDPQNPTSPTIGSFATRKLSLVSTSNSNNNSQTVTTSTPLKKSPSSAAATNGFAGRLARANSMQQPQSQSTKPLQHQAHDKSEQPTSQLKQLTRANSTDTSMVEKLTNQNFITCDQFLACWLYVINSCFDLASKFIHLLTFGQRSYLIPDDFVPLVQSIIDDHPGLKFLRSAPDFHMRYIQTVIARIYYSVNKSWTGKITAHELRRSNFLAVLQVLSQEDDINQVTDYFSYEHFYVIYCKFWNLDQDHDLLISKEDLARHNDASISSRIIDRIFAGIISKQIQKTGKMSYTDFVWFLIAEEDKKHPRSVEYWFRLMDLDGDGYISLYELEYFYYEQIRRLELMNIEALPFLDSVCQILDLVNPKEKNKISLSDLKRTKMATIFFDTFINLEKYLEHESREFVSTRDVVQDGVVISDWDRYASEEYESLVTEESSV